MGKSIKGKELGKGITQRKSDGLYQGRFVNRFGKTQTIYASNLNELRKKMREEQYEDEKAIDSDLLTKNVAKQLNTVIFKEDKRERRVMTVSEAELFLGEAQSSYYYNLFVIALETGMRIGELCGLQWQDIDFEKKVLYVRHTLCYFRKDGKYIFEMHGGIATTTYSKTKDSL